MIRRPQTAAERRTLRFQMLGVSLALAAAVAAGSGKSAPLAAPSPAAAAATHDGEIRLDHISVVKMGQGAPVILIPGLSSPRAVWNGVAPELAKTHTVYLVQVNGFAGDAPGANLGEGVLDGIVADLSRYIAMEKLGKPAIVGHSMGGLVGMMLALAHPDRVGRLMVVDSLPFFGAVMGAPDVASIRPRAEAMRTAIAGNYEAARKRAEAGPVTSDPGGNLSITPEGRIQVANWAMHADLRVVAQAMYEDMTTDLRGDIAKIAPRPFTIVYAAGAPQANAIWEGAYAGSGAKLVAVPGSDHFVMLDQPAAFAAALTAFLAE